ncbi:MAG: NUDIX domain-containing protein [Rhizobiales bacterium]|nr:NUDIX domain-containing protein [Hyphomicrobiales bacterium]
MAGLIRRFSPLILMGIHISGRLIRGVTLGVRAVVLAADGSIFLVKHSYLPGWHLPGGGVETGETLRQAVARELQEEGNVTLTAEPELFAVYLNRGPVQRDHVALYVVRAFTQTPPQPNREIVDHGFFPPDALPPETTGATRRRVAEVVDGEPRSELW